MSEERIEGLQDSQEVALSDDIEITEIHCHECNGYVKFALDKSKNGEHVVICPKCKHEHCRTIKDGIVTADRWASRNKNQPINPNIQTYFIQVSMDNYSTQGWQVIQPTGAMDSFLNDAWGNQTSASANIASGTFYYTASASWTYQTL